MSGVEPTIGKTARGHAVYTPNHPSYAHLEKVRMVGADTTHLGQLARQAHPHYRAVDHEEASAMHYARRNFHAARAHEAASAAMSKSEGEGSRGGKVIGHTKSGKPVYSGDHDTYKNLKPLDDYVKENHGKNWQPHFKSLGDHVIAAFPSYTKADHRDAVNVIRAHGRAHVDSDAGARAGANYDAHLNASKQVKYWAAKEIKKSDGGMVPAYASNLAWVYEGADPSLSLEDAAGAIRAVTLTWSAQDHLDNAVLQHCLAQSHGEGDTPEDLQRQALCAAAAFMHFAAAGVDPTSGPVAASMGKGPVAKSLAKLARAELGKAERAATEAELAAVVRKALDPKALKPIVPREPAKIGTTRSGKPIFDVYHHPAHKDFDAKDWADAGRAVAAGMQFHAKVAARKRTPVTKSAVAKGAKPLGAAFSHARKVAAKTGGGKAKERAVAQRYLSAKGHGKMAKAGEGEGSRGGHVIGHTARGNPVYSHGNACIHVDSGSERRTKGGERAGNVYHINPGDHFGDKPDYDDTTLCATRFKNVEGYNPLGHDPHPDDKLDEDGESQKVNCKRCIAKKAKMMAAHEAKKSLCAPRDLSKARGKGSRGGVIVGFAPNGSPIYSGHRVRSSKARKEAVAEAKKDDTNKSLGNQVFTIRG